MFVKLYILLSIILDALFVYFNVDGKFTVWDIIIPILFLVATFISFIVLHVLFVYICSLFINKNKYCEKPSKFCKFWMDKTINLLFDVFRIKVIVDGIEKLPTDRRFLFVSNHRSNFDPLICIDKLSKYNIAFISKPENFKLPIVGQFISRCCFLAIDRENARNAMKTIHKATDYVKNDIVSMAVYPEGTRSKTGELLDFKDGVFYIAKKVPCPIVVSTVKNTENAFKHIIIKQTKVYLNIIDIIEPEEFVEMTTHEISNKVKEMMIQNLK